MVDLYCDLLRLLVISSPTVESRFRSRLFSLLSMLSMKVLMLTIFYTCLKSTHDDPNRDITEHLHNTNFDLSIDEEYLHCLQASGESPLSSNAIRCLTRVNVVRARQIRLQEIQMWSIIREGVMSVAFLLVLGLLIYSTRDHHNSHLQVDHLRKLFLNHRNHELDYTKVINDVSSVIRIDLNRLDCDDRRILVLARE